MFNSEDFKKIAQKVDYHLDSVKILNQELNEIKDYLVMIIQQLDRKEESNIKNIMYEMQEISSQLKRYGLPQKTSYEKSFEITKKILENEKWPEAVNPRKLCKNDETKKIQRAQAILDVFVIQSLVNKKILDFGCGEDHLVKECKNRNCSYALGYDINCEITDDLTNDFKTVQDNSPYDIIVMNDVIDHLINEDPVEVLKKLKKLLARNGRIYVKAHPWTSKHGSHIYETINKAYIHLIFDEIELTRLGVEKIIATNKTIKPIEDYRNWFDKAGLTIVSELPIKSKLPQFFLEEEIIKEKLIAIWGNIQDMKENMEIDFIEYTLENKELDISISL